MLLVLAEAASADDLSTIVGVATIAERAELNKRTVIAALKLLAGGETGSDGAAAGQAFIRRSRRFNPTDGSRTSDRIVLLVAAQSDGDALRDASQGEPDALRPAAQSDGDALRGGTKVHVTARLGASDGPPRCSTATLSVSCPSDHPVTTCGDLPSGQVLPFFTDTPFERWWTAYPNKTGRKTAKAKFDRIIKSGEASLDQLIAGAEQYAQSDKVRRGYAKNPVTWLNGGCWTDEAQNHGNSLSGAQWALGAGND
ncbi:hypothetical protein [Caulobacter sp. B11]|uniref:hypothetical protein n=1 Tax=Caulobacter sp. B11 TaxID=2048899 RepID=UPI00117DBEA1|nr:hypothetical protein [Caulobacter sp. B11]